MVKALINHYPEYVIKRRLFKFENNGEILDGGFISTDSEVFHSTLSKLNAYYNYPNESPYLPNYIRIYECIGTADGRDFFVKEHFRPNNIVNDEEVPLEKKFSIPKYIVLKRDKKTETWLPDNQRICVCIS